MEGAAGQEVDLYRPKTSLFPGLSIGMPQRVAVVGEAILPSEGLHLRMDEGVGSGAAQPRQVGVVNDALPGGIAPEGERLVEEALHPEAVKGAVELEVTAFAVAQVNQAGDEPRAPTCQLDLVNTGVMLHLRSEEHTSELQSRQ